MLGVILFMLVIGVLRQAYEECCIFWVFIAHSTLNIHKDISTQAFGDGQNLLSIKKHEMAVIPYLLLFLLGWFCLVYQTQLEMNSRHKQRLARSVLCMCFRL